MTSDRELERLLDRWLDDGPTQSPDRVLFTAADRIGRQRQRPAWRLQPGRFPAMTFAGRLVAALVLLLVVLLGGTAWFVGSQSPAPAPSPSPSPTPTATPGPVPDAMTGGRYVFGPFGQAPSVTVVATGPDGWKGFPSWAMDGPAPVRADAPSGIAVAFFTANGMFSDPCHWDVRGVGNTSQPGDVAVGPTVDDLVTALHANTFYTSTAATPVTIDGYAGKELELQLPAEPSYDTCDKDDPTDSGGHVFVFSGPGLYAQGQANRWHLYILDVEGTRLIAAVLSYEGTPKAALDLASSIIQTLDINP